MKIKMRNYKFYLLVFLALLPILFLRDYTPGNELRYLSIANEAIGNHTFFTFTNHGIPYADKPPLYFWIIMFGKWLFGEYYMGFLSLFSLLPAFVITEIMNCWTADVIQSEFRPTVQLLLLTCGLFTGMIVTLRMDMLMCMFITLSLYTFYKMEKSEDKRRKNTILFPIYIFLAVFTKGPLGLLIPLLSIFVYLLLTKRIRRFGRYWGWKTWGILLFFCIVWFSLSYMEAGSGYLYNLLFHQTLGRAFHSFHHEAPFYYYGIAIWYSMAPWSLLILGIITAAVYKKYIITDLQKFFLTTAVTTFVLLSFVSSKLSVYLLPAYPFLVYLAVIYMPHFLKSFWIKVGIGIPAILFCFSILILWRISHMDGISFLGLGLFYAAAGILTITGLLTLYNIYCRQQMNRAIQTFAIGLLSAVFVGSLTLPQINQEIGYGKLCDKALEIAQVNNVSTFYVWKIFRAENMDVYLHKKVHTATLDDLTSERLHHTVLMLPENELDKFSEKPFSKVGRYAIILLK
jgi:4-amino-4-deoxy-L-arabinose transferase-like glycosyltransferase